MMNNPILQMVSMARSGKNPMALMQQMAKSNPQVNQVMQMMNGKSPAQLKAIAENVAKEKGTTVEQVAQQLGLSLPTQR